MIAIALLGTSDSWWLTLEPGNAVPVSTVPIPGLAHTEVVRLLGASGEPEGYLAALADPEFVDERIERCAARLGPALMQPLARELATRGLDEICIVPLGLLGLLPLHALSWPEPGGDVCLLDRASVSYAPSVFARVICEERAAARHERTSLVCVADPTDDLDHAEAEARIAAGLLQTDEDAVLLVRDAATKVAVTAAMSGAAYVHLACHGTAIAADAMESALWLAAGERVTARELVELDLHAARLVVASACESGVLGNLEAADEALAIATVMIGAGAAGVVSSLWRIDDRATAVLMSRFYRELEDGTSPARALRNAVCWLRSLSAADLAAHELKHPGLRISDGVAGSCGSSADVERPFAAPSAWAALIFSGA